MQTFVMSVLGMVLISVLVEIILPSGQTSKYIKSIIAIFVVFVFVNPLLNLVKSDFNIKDYIGESEVNINAELLNTMYEKKVNAISEDIVSFLEDTGYINVKLKIDYKIENNDIVFNKVSVNIDELVINSDQNNINKYDYIRQAVLTKINIKEENVIFE